MVDDDPISWFMSAGGCNRCQIEAKTLYPFRPGRYKRCQIEAKHCSFPARDGANDARAKGSRKIFTIPDPRTPHRPSLIKERPDLSATEVYVRGCNKDG